MTFDGRNLTFSRDDSDFPQRFHGALSPGGRTIAGTWERSGGPGQPLRHDFDITYRRVA